MNKIVEFGSDADNYMYNRYSTEKKTGMNEQKHGKRWMGLKAATSSSSIMVSLQLPQWKLTWKTNWNQVQQTSWITSGGKMYAHFVTFFDWHYVSRFVDTSSCSYNVYLHHIIYRKPIKLNIEFVTAGVIRTKNSLQKCDFISILMLIVSDFFSEMYEIWPINIL